MKISGQYNIFKNDKKQIYTRSIKCELPVYYLYKFTRSFFYNFIFRGGKLRAFNYLRALKINLKDTELVDPIWPFVAGCVNIMPEVMLLPRKLGGKIHGVPSYITEWKQIVYVIKWVVRAYKKKHRTLKISGISTVIAEAVYNRGDAIDQKLAIYDIGLNNRHLIRKGPRWKRRAKFRRRRRLRKKRRINKKKFKFRRAAKQINIKLKSNLIFKKQKR